MNNLLSFAESFKANLPLGLFMFILGMLVIFFGMTIIVLVVSVIGKIMTKSTSAPKKVEEAPIQEVSQVQVESEEIPDHVKAAIVAAITAYYFNENSSKCEFRVKKIKRI